MAQRVTDLLARMTLDDKIGQMTQAERGVISPAQLTQYRVGSVLSGGGSGPARTPRPPGPTWSTTTSAVRWPPRWASR
ncbi:hypothetical protein GCM10020358_29050 [Amorphoplanes nipponensis]|uniref:hypothetical protein n=1 Tax=Actinoplanes nipponensis TaxID=135950 RepID=UPI0031F039DF